MGGMASPAAHRISVHDKMVLLGQSFGVACCSTMKMSTIFPPLLWIFKRRAKRKNLFLVYFIFESN